MSCREEDCSCHTATWPDKFDIDFGPEAEEYHDGPMMVLSVQMECKTCGCIVEYSHD